MQQRLREMACVAFLLRNRERMKDLLDAGDHAAFGSRLRNYSALEFIYRSS